MPRVSHFMEIKHCNRNVLLLVFVMVGHNVIPSRAGMSTWFTSTSTGNMCEYKYYNMGPGLGSIPFFQFNSNSIIFNSNSNSTTHNKFQFQFRRFQFQFQFRRFEIPVSSVREMTCWCLEIDYNYTRYLLLIPSVSYRSVNYYNYMASWWILYQ